jgi:histone deacetylase 11
MLNKKTIVLIVVAIISFYIFSNYNNKTIDNLEIKNKIPIVYREEYNIRLMGFEKLHPFDTQKFKNVFDKLILLPNVHQNQFYEPEQISDSLLKSIHSNDYLKSLENKEKIVSIVELGPLSALPTSFLINNLIVPVKYASQGTVIAGIFKRFIFQGELALKYGWSINLGGGFHHAHVSLNPLTKEKRWRRLVLL